MCPKPPEQEKDKEQSKSRTGKQQAPLEKPKKKRVKLSKETEKGDALLEMPEKPNVQSAVPELSEDPFPAILSKSLESLKSPTSNSDRASKVPKLKLILRNRNTKEPSAGLEVESKVDKLTEKTEEANPMQDEKDASLPGKISECRKSVESPVAMDISPQRTTPCTSGSVSPITVVLCKRPI